jgi:hypothetical protein
VRKQYHFRQSPQGLLAWDVNRLVQLTQGLEPVLVPLAEIAELREPYWFDYGERPTVEAIAEHCRLMNEADLAFPIILCPARRVMDGMHRVAKAVVEGKSHIAAFVLPTEPVPDFVGRRPEDLPY